MWFYIVVVGPLIEEILFRGVILRGMLGHLRPGWAIAWSALMFGAFHMNFPQGVSATFLGVLFGWAYWRTRSLGLCCVLHIVNNGLAMGCSVLGWNDEDLGIPLWAVAIAMGFVAYGLIRIPKTAPAAAGASPVGLPAELAAAGPAANVSTN